LNACSSGACAVRLLRVAQREFRRMHATSVWISPITTCSGFSWISRLIVALKRRNVVATEKLEIDED
jgi:hypothetical protein